MKLMIVRHGDPDYEHDSLTEKGWREAEFLGERLARLEFRAVYVSPLGRARDTAKPALRRLGRSAVECDWLREFHAPIQKPGAEGLSIPWDWLPLNWTADPRYFQPESWMETEAMRSGDVAGEYRRVCGALDRLLAEHGYEREGKLYRVRQSGRETLLFFCHFGVECVLLSHLLNISPMPLWHGLCAAPSSVTTLVTEERREGIAAFRMLVFGDISHLTAHAEPPSFAARFCETFDCAEERHD